MELRRRIIVSVISDLVTDQRVHKVCTFLQENYFNVTLIGRKTKNSLPLEKRVYETERLYAIFNKGVLLYAEFMTRLFLKLLFKKADVYLANDLDTLLPNFLISNLRNKTLVYDSHEYFTGVPELENSPVKKRVWKSLENFILPKIRHAYTVNQSIANLYRQENGINMQVVRNLPVLAPANKGNHGLYSKDKIILLLQGAGINEERGAEELVESMRLLPENFKLYLIGGGNCWNKLKHIVKDLKLQGKVEFIEKVSFSALRDYTMQAHLGVSLDKPHSLNYKLSLPNKVFDYIHAGIPVLSSSVVEVKNIIDAFEVGTTIDLVTPPAIADAVSNIFSNQALYQQWKENTVKAAEILCWQKEEETLKKIFSSV